jgi:hypothetical protein
MSKRAFITGITGQDGSYLSELLLSKGYEVFGLVRRASSLHTARIDHLYRDPHEPGVRLKLVYGDLTDGSSLARLLRSIEPDEDYNLAAQSHVRVSFDLPEHTANVTASGACACSRRCATRAFARASIRPRRASSSAARARRRRARRRLFRPGALTRAPRRTPTTSRSRTARATVSTRSAASSSTTSRRAAARPSCRARSRAPLRG